MVEKKAKEVEVLKSEESEISRPKAKTAVKSVEKSKEIEKVKEKETAKETSKAKEKETPKAKAEEKPKSAEIAKPVKKGTSQKKAKIEMPKKSAEIKALVELIKLKRNNHPIFRGRFGKRTIRKKGIDKWNKWRKPRGIDLRHEKEDGFWPDTGYRSANQIRFLHPSGYSEVMVRNVNEVESASKQKNIVLRMSSTVGTKKRKEILKKAFELKLRVLN